MKHFSNALSGFYLISPAPKTQNQSLQPATKWNCSVLRCYLASACYLFLHSKFRFLFRVGRLDSHRTKVFCAVSAGSVQSCLISGKVEGKNAPSQIKTRDTDYCILHAWLPYSRLEVYERKCEFRNIARVLLHVLCFWYDFFWIIFMQAVSKLDW